MTEVFKIERHSPRRGDNYVVREKSSKSNGSVIRWAYQSIWHGSWQTNFSSGGPVDDAVAEILLDVFDNGNIQSELF